MLPNGTGINLLPITEDADFERAPTLNDLKLMGIELVSHMETVNIQSKIMAGMEAEINARVAVELRKAGIKLKPGRQLH